MADGQSARRKAISGRPGPSFSAWLMPQPKTVGSTVPLCRVLRRDSARAKKRAHAAMGTGPVSNS